MQKQSVVVILLMTAALYSPLSSADGHHGGHHGGGHHGGFGHRSGFSIGLYAGSPYYGYPYYYGSPYGYGYGSSYYYNPPVVVTSPPPPPVYIEQAAPAPDPADKTYWYYCTDPQGYYPYVRDCKVQWQTVEPVPAGK